ncbi:MAG TPA: T9SS type A sorting domain-containing protein [Gemmatimonadales bacterium]|nr:T9SS type A sorting domain-containing protein [Gemmatimonadales bacterium]
MYLAHVLRDGSVAEWDPHPNDSVTCLVLQGGTLYVGGSFTEIGGAPRRYLAAVDTRTGLASRWDPEPDWYVFALAARGRTVFAGGAFTTMDGQPRQFLAAIDARSGKASTPLPEPDSWVRALLVHQDHLYVGGEFYHVDGEARRMLARIDLQTHLLTSWDARLFGEDIEYGPSASVLSLQADGNALFVAGLFSAVSGLDRPGLAAVDVRSAAASAWKPQIELNADFAPHFDVVLVHDGSVYVGGSTGGPGARYAAAFDEITGMLSAWDPRTNGEVFTFAATDSTIYVGGQFSSLGGVERHNVAALDAVTGEATPWNPDANHQVLALTVSGDAIYLGGYFSRLGAVPRHNIGVVDRATGAATAWNPYSNGPVFSLAVGRGVVYAAGWFDIIGGADRSFLAAIDSASGSATAWDPQANDIVNVVVASDSAVYAGGWFYRIGGGARSSIAALSPGTGRLLAWDAACDHNVVNTIAVGGGVVYFGGSFRRVGGQGRSGVAAVDSVTGAVLPWNPVIMGGTTLSPVVNAVAVDQGHVYVGGDYFEVSGESRSCLASFDRQTGALTVWNPTANNPVRSLWASDGVVYAGGNFSSILNEPHAGIAAILDPPTAAKQPVAAVIGNSDGLVHLSRVAPNPIQTVATIRFSLPRALAVTAAIFDLQGRRVANLRDGGIESAGEHEVRIQTAGWAPGCYLYEFEAGGLRRTEKLVVLR